MMQESDGRCLAFFRRKDPALIVETINFRQFVRVLARFKQARRGGEEQGLNTLEKKMECNACLCTGINQCVCVCVCVCVCACIRVRACVRAMCACMCVPVCVCVCIRVHACMCMRSHVHVFK